MKTDVASKAMGELTHDDHACPGCGHEVPRNAIACPRCGEALTDAENVLAPLHAIRRKLFMASGVLFVLALTAFLLGGTGSDLPIVASIGLGLMASVVLALALAV